MAKPRKRFDGEGRALPCSVTIPADLSAELYAAKVEDCYRDETELVVSIIRAWAKDRRQQKNAEPTSRGTP